MLLGSAPLRVEFDRADRRSDQLAQFRWQRYVQEKRKLERPSWLIFKNRLEFHVSSAEFRFRVLHFYVSALDYKLKK